MKFKGQYLTYSDYKTLGGTLDIMPFNLLEFEARKNIDINTQKRLNGIEEIPEEVKICIYNLINKIESYVIENHSNKNLSSESIGDYSVSYISPNEIKEVVKSKSAELNDIIMTDLYGVIVNNEHIIYLGAN